MEGPFTPEELAEAARDLTPEERATIDAVRAALALLQAPRQPDEPLH